MLKGTIIRAKHVDTERIFSYMVVAEGAKIKSEFRLVNLISGSIMNGFKAINEQEIMNYISKVLKLEILEVRN